VQRVIYDTFTFFNEIELLELRLHELADVVDKFVLVEATRTHANQPKPLHYAENKARFSAFHDKIMHIVVDDMPDSSDAWVLERHQRNCIVRALDRCRPDDLILVSDADEIARASAVQEASDRVRAARWRGANVVRGAFRSRPATTWFRKRVRRINPFIWRFEQDFYCYFLNCVLHSGPHWCGTRMLQFRDFTTADEARYSGYHTVKNGGWHFSYMGGVERIQQKLTSFCHREMDTPEYTDPNRIAARIASGQDLFDRSDQYTFVELDERFPRYVLENRDKFAGWIKEL
jgi:hypothetical protein